MTYVFRRLDITWFDVHIALRPLEVPESQAVQEACRFLVRGKEYGERYASQTATETPHFRIRPLSPRELGWGHFWKSYSQTWWRNGKPDYWKLQLPFLCKLRQPIRLDRKAAGLPPDAVHACVVPEVFLSALGWSVNIKVQLSGRIEINALIAFLDRLRDPKCRAFIVDGRNRSLPEAQESISQMLVDDVYADVYVQQNGLAGILMVHRHMVVSVTDFEGPRQPYRSTWRDQSGSDEMNAGDRALMQSILHMRPVSVEEAAKQQIAHTPFDHANFAISNFDHGTLLFMQDMAKRDVAEKSQRSLHCLDRNVCRFSMMILMWMRFYGATEDRTEPKLRTLRGFAPRTLKELSETYINSVCQTFFRNHKGLRKVAFGATVHPMANNTGQPLQKNPPETPAD